jgi:hypothetical protein
MLLEGYLIQEPSDSIQEAFFFSYAWIFSMAGFENV